MSAARAEYRRTHRKRWANCPDTMPEPWRTAAQVAFLCGWQEPVRLFVEPGQGIGSPVRIDLSESAVNRISYRMTRMPHQGARECARRCAQMHAAAVKAAL